MLHQNRARKKEKDEEGSCHGLIQGFAWHMPRNNEKPQSKWPVPQLSESTGHITCSGYTLWDFNPHHIPPLIHCYILVCDSWGDLANRGEESTLGHQHMEIRTKHMLLQDMHLHPLNWSHNSQVHKNNSFHMNRYRIRKQLVKLISNLFNYRTLPSLILLSMHSLFCCYNTAQIIKTSFSHAQHLAE